MTYTEHKLVPAMAQVVVATKLPSGCVFVVRTDDGSNAYVPVNVAKAVSAEVGDTFEASLVPNRFPDKSSRCPWLAVHLSRSSKPAPVSQPVQYVMPFQQFDLNTAEPAPVSIAERVRQCMEGGGVWTVSTMYMELFPSKTRGVGTSEYNAVSAALRSMFAAGKCSKFQLWRTHDQSKPSREWFTCYPERADVDEWEEK